MTRPLEVAVPTVALVLISAAGPGLVLAADSGFFVNITCGQDAIKQVTLGLILPSSIAPSEAQVGADVFGETDCLGGATPDDCIGATGLFSAVDATMSRVVPANTAGVPDAYHFTLVGAQLNHRLCDPARQSLYSKWSHRLELHPAQS